ncbi:MAG: DUF1176 domain-containing protein [Rhizobiales bacterium]|nr:DUF1176 domain-containing protein [Hyphomicrobiales bacterium]
MRAALAAGLLALAAPALAAPVGKSFKDWEVACDNAGDCVAHGYQKYEDRRSEHWLRLDMKAGPAARPTLSGAAKGVDIDKATLLDAPADLAGKPLVEQLIGVAKKAETATLSSDGKTKATFSLSGLAAALLVIDEAQGRVGAATALIRPGPKPASAVPGPKPLPRVAPKPVKGLPAGDEAVRVALARRLKATIGDDCPRQDDGEGSGDIWRLSKTLSLVELYCDSGAYNFRSRFYLVEGRGAARRRPGPPRRPPEGDEREPPHPLPRAEGGRNAELLRQGARPRRLRPARRLRLDRQVLRAGELPAASGMQRRARRRRRRRRAAPSPVDRRDGGGAPAPVAPLAARAPGAGRDRK